MINARLYLAFVVMAVPIDSVPPTNDFLGCHRIPPMKSFQLQKFIGRWYAIAKSDPTVQADLKCSMYDTKFVNSTTFNATSSTKNVWTNKEYNGTIFLKQKYQNIPGIFISGSGNPHDNITIVDTDYRTYLVVHNCLGNSILEYEEAVILGRKPTMDQKTLDKAKKKLQSYKFYTNMFTAVDQLDC